MLTFQQRPGDCFDPVRERIRRAKGRIRAMAADYLLYALIDAVVDDYFPVLERYGDNLESIESSIISDPEPESIERLHELRRGLLALRRSLWPTRDMLSALQREGPGFISEATRVYVRDAHDHTVQLIDIIETYREIAAGLIEIYLSSLSTRLNEVMKILTLMATVFLPLTFITSLYGMNFDRRSPWNMPELGWRLGGLLVYFWRKGWFKS